MIINIDYLLQICLCIKEAIRNTLIRVIRNLSTRPPTQYDFDQVREKKSNIQFLFISFIVFAIEICYAVETAFVSPILQRIGVPIPLMSMVWGLSPIIGFIVCPIMGVLSDNCHNLLGRRRPFIIIYSFGILCGLVLLGYGTTLGDLIWNSQLNEPNPFIILLTICGVVLLDFNCDACQSPARAYLIDISNSADHSTGLSTFTLMAGAGGTLGYCLGGISWDKNQSNSQIKSLNITEKMASSERYYQRNLFTCVAILYVICTLLCISSFKEIPLNFIEQFEDYESMSDTEEDEAKFDIDASNYSLNSVVLSHRFDTNVENLQLTAGLKMHIKSLIDMPIYLRWLCLTHCFSWISLLCFSLYFTDFVGEVVYGGDPLQQLDLAKHEIYSHGVRIGSICMALYSITCSFYSFYLRNLINLFGTQYVYVFSQLLYAAGMICLAVTKSILVVPLTAITAGITYSSLFTIPFILVARYHSKETNTELLFNDQNVISQRGIGADLSLISSMVFVAQIFLSSFIGVVMKLFGSKVVVLYTAAFFSSCAALTSNKILFL